MDVNSRCSEWKTTNIHTTVKHTLQKHKHQQTDKTEKYKLSVWMKVRNKWKSLFCFLGVFWIMKDFFFKCGLWVQTWKLWKKKVCREKGREWVVFTWYHQLLQGASAAIFTPQLKRSLHKLTFNYFEQKRETGKRMIGSEVKVKVRFL